MFLTEQRLAYHEVNEEKVKEEPWDRADTLVQQTLDKYEKETNAVLNEKYAS